MFTETNPDKGTETSVAIIPVILIIILFTETNPDKGTETMIMKTLQLKHQVLTFTETNPDKGTETLI